MFTIVSGKQPNLSNRFDLKREGMVNTITGATTRNGINFYSYSDQSYNNELTISKDGEYAGTVFLQTKPFIIGGHCMGLIAKTPLSNLCKVYISTLINKFKPIWRGKDRPSVQKSRLEELEIDLPFFNRELAFSYMENYIKTLEVERIERLEAYLQVTSLKDYRLTRNDKQILDTFEKLNDTKSSVEEWSTCENFYLQDILTWCTGISELNPLKLDELLDEDEREYPFYGQATINNGIISYYRLRKEFLNNKNSRPTILIHSNNQNIVYLESPFYLKDGHGATSVLQSEELNRYTAFYLMTATKKVIERRFNYNAKATKIGLKETQIQLPTKNGEVDYQFMSDFIRVVEKIVIKDVIEWTDRKISETKEFVFNK